MKILLATPLYPPEIGGPATYAKELVDGLPERGIEVELLKFSDVRHLPKFIRHVAYFRKAVQAAKQVDIILTLDPVSVGLPVMKAAQKAGKPYIVKIVGDYAWEQGVQRFGVTQSLDEFVQTQQTNFFVKKLQKIQTRVAKKAIKIIVPSQYLKNIVCAWGIAPERVEVIYNAVSVESIGQVPQAIEKMPRPIIVTVGRLVEWKGIDGLIRVFDGVWSARREGSNVSLVIVGSGPEEAKLKEHATKLRLEGGCLFTGNLSHEDTLAVIKTADVFVLNSSYEGLSHVLVEALKLGSCIIVTNVGGNPEVVSKDDGFLVNVNDERMLASSLKMLIEHEETRVAFKEKARNAGHKFSVENMLSATVLLLNKL